MLGDAITDSRLTDAPIRSHQSNNILPARDTLRRSPIDVQNTFGFTVQNDHLSGADIALTVEPITTGVKVIGSVFSHNRIGVALLPVGSFPELGNTIISGNTFRNNRAAGAWFEARSPSGTTAGMVTGNRFSFNGRDSGGLLDRFGNTVDDGLHIDGPGNTGFTVTGNYTDHNADFGIEVRPGTVTDGGGDTSDHDPSGCLGVVCT